MCRKKKSILIKMSTIVLSLMIAVVFMPLVPGTGTAKAAAVTEIKVNDQTLDNETPRLDSTGTAASGTHVSGDIAYFDRDSGTLDLYSGTIDKTLTSKAGICAGGDLSIVLKGNTSIKGQDSIYDNYGINCRQSDLTISGSGSLSITAGNGDCEYNDGISCDDLILNGGTITARGGNQSGWSNGIECGSITVNKGAVLTATGGDPDVSAGIGYTGSVIINGGTVKAVGNTNAVIFYDNNEDNSPGKVILGSGVKAYTAASLDPYESAVTAYASGTQMASTVKWFSTAKATKTMTNIKGRTFTSGALKYKITTIAGSGYGRVQVTGAKKKRYKSLTIPRTVKYGIHTYALTSIAGKAFKADKKVKKVTFKSKTITSIGRGAFKKCKKGVTFKIPKKQYKKYRKLLRKSGVPKNAKYKKY